MSQPLWVNKKFIRPPGFSNKNWSLRHHMGMFVATLHTCTSISSPLKFAAIDQNDLVIIRDAGKGWAQVWHNGVTGFMLIV